MSTLRQAGGVAALVQALAYVVGFAVIATALDAGDTSGWSALQKLEFALDRKLGFQLWMLFVYVVFGMALVVLTAALQERLARRARGLMQVGTPFGYLWAGLVIASGMVASVGIDGAAALYAQDAPAAASLWRTVGVVQDGLGGGVEVVGGAWMLLTSAGAMRAGAFPRALVWLGLLVGIAGIATLAPPLGAMGAVFGLGQIPWFVWVARELLRRPHALAAQERGVAKADAGF